MNDDSQAQFLLELDENLRHLDDTLDALETDPDPDPLVAEVMRMVHTIKSACGFLGFERLEDLTHAAESLLVLTQDAQLELGSEHRVVLRSMVSEIEASLAHAQEHGEEGPGQGEDVIGALQALALRGRSVERVTEEQEFPPPLGRQLIEHGHLTEAEIDEALDTQDSGDERRVGDILVEKGLVDRSQVEDAARTQDRIARRVLRIQTELVDELQSLSDDLTEALYELLQHHARMEDEDGLIQALRIEQVAAKLAERLRRIHMQPIDRLWSRYAQVVSTLGGSLGKRVRLEASGGDLEIERELIDALAAPLAHLVRNAVDHGIETPDRRVGADKPAEGVLELKAFLDHGHVCLEVRDDGRGLDLARLREHAVERGLVPPDAELDDAQVQELVFAPGLSTAGRITRLSGRGVGMDAVRSRVERLGGTIELTSVPGEGTTVRLRVPLNGSLG